MLDSDVPANKAMQYPGVNVGGVPTAYYSEGMRIGYRWYDDQGITPRYPFGFGLSYTTFSVSAVKAGPAKSDGPTPIKVTARVRNTGNRTGAEFRSISECPLRCRNRQSTLSAFGRSGSTPTKTDSIDRHRSAG